ncbi:MAG: hypothetical protein P5681_09685 [Limnospira sp. PMC 894.15]|uniref:Uncharacterized protein n=1 Tax=Limnospira fusiformis PMC 851.14 TaxID=2219512 RepID=A0ABU9EFA9_LIMFS|nr:MULTISPECIES: hypothetical protein [Limnospira]MDT9188081.1 hypothetical protein [Limnospira sp. PMC 894.15]MDT9274784.1 hypothetical protein [Limnospira sp. PMC 737.11]MDY7053511.1 hypothetical protein [Limnospira fusiformis LS22]QNH60446.1 MAG: hypothetical protein H2674_08600 [Limnospira indica BM01]
MSAVQVRLLAFLEKPDPDCDRRGTLNPVVVPNYSDITHNLVLAQENNSVNRMITQSTSTT